MKYRSKFVVYLLLLAVLFHASLSAIYFFPVKRILEKKVAAIFKEENQLLSIFFTGAQFARVAKLHEREFIYQGEFYDIKSKTIKNDTVYLTVYRDKHETSLFSHLQHLMKNSSNGEGKKQSISLLKMFDLFDVEKNNKVPVKQFAFNTLQYFQQQESLKCNLH